jgi:ribosomal protein S6
MSKVKKETRGHYELLYIVPNNFTEEEALQIHEKVKENLTQRKAEIGIEEIWGKKKFAYRIKEFYHGYYNLIEFDCDKENLAIINNYLKLLDEVLRYQIVKKKELDKKEIERRERIQERNKKEEREEEEKDRRKKEGIDVDEEEVVEEKDDEGKKEEKAVDADEKKEESKDEVKEEESGKEGSAQSASGAADESLARDSKEDKKKTDLDELDKKLDNILNTDDLI